MSNYSHNYVLFLHFFKQLADILSKSSLILSHTLTVCPAQVALPIFSMFYSFTSATDYDIYIFDFVHLKKGNMFIWLCYDKIHFKGT